MLRRQSRVVRADAAEDFAAKLDKELVIERGGVIPVQHGVWRGRDGSGFRCELI
jgi:hypothetical protein